MLKGSIRKRGDKFQVIFPYKDEYGEWKQKSKTCNTMSQAKSALKSFNLETNQSLDNPTMEVVTKLWINEISLHASKNTISAYEYNSQFVIDRLGNKKVKEIQRKDLVKLYQTIREEGYETKAYVSCVNMIMNFAIKSNFISVNVGKGITVTRTNDKRSVVILNQEDRINLLREIKGTQSYYMVNLLLKTGLRIGEALGLPWKNVNFDIGAITVKQQLLINKTISEKLKSKNSVRTIYLDRETITMLKELKLSAYSGTEYVFSDKEKLRNRVSRFLFDHDLTPHDLRHNHGTDLLDICNIADAAQRMGHTVEEYVATYVHASDDAQVEIANKLNSDSYSLCDNLVTEGRGRVVELAKING